MTIPSVSLLEILERYSADAKPGVPNHQALWREMYEMVFEDNKKLTAEVRQLMNRLAPFEGQKRLEAIQLIEKQFPRKGRKRCR